MPDLLLPAPAPATGAGLRSLVETRTWLTPLSDGERTWAVTNKARVVAYLSLDTSPVLIDVYGTPLLQFRDSDDSTRLEVASPDGAPVFEVNLRGPRAGLRRSRAAQVRTPQGQLVAEVRTRKRQVTLQVDGKPAASLLMAPTAGPAVEHRPLRAPADVDGRLVAAFPCIALRLGSLGSSATRGHSNGTART